MNAYHRHLCASPDWARCVESKVLPWGLDGLELGDDVLEIGPGFGVTTRLLARQVPRLTALEVDGDYADLATSARAAASSRSRRATTPSSGDVMSCALDRA